jgi:hypothetical protein
MLIPKRWGKVSAIAAVSDANQTLVVGLDPQVLNVAARHGKSMAASLR